MSERPSDDRRVKSGEIPSLTGLRGVAALLVVVAHYSVWRMVTPVATRPLWIERLGDSGTIGMAIFFTLSGYVIALSYSNWDWRARPAFNLVRFFFYRFARLYPAFFLFAVLILMREPKLRDLADADARANVLQHLLLWQTWWPVKFGGVNVAGGFFHVSWSISTECALYLMFALGIILVSFLPTFRYRSLVLGVAFFWAATWLLDLAYTSREQIAPQGWTEPEWRGWLYYLSPYAAVVLFGIGVTAYRISLLSLPPKWLKMASDFGALSFVVIFTRMLTNVPDELFTKSLATAVATGFLMAGAKSDSIANRLLSARGIVYVGTISYSLYLFHFAVPQIFYGQFDTLDGLAIVTYALNFTVALAIAIMLATGIYRLVEIPGRRIIRTAADRLLGIGLAAPTPIARSTPADPVSSLP